MRNKMPAPKGHAPYPGCEKGGRPKKYTKDLADVIMMMLSVDPK